MAINLISLGSNIVQDDVKGGGFLTIVGDHGARAADNLACSAIGIALSKTAPLSELSAGIDHDKVDTRLVAQGLDQLHVLVVVAVLGEAAEAGSASVEGLSAPE